MPILTHDIIEVSIPSKHFSYTTCKFPSIKKDKSYCFNKCGLFYKWKCFFDFVCATILLIILSPFFLIISLIIILESKGAPFFIQKRQGLNGEDFKIYKFRTMHKNSHLEQYKLASKNEMDGIIFKISNDSRITGFGKFLRKYSIDELPQLVNVFKGNMSFIGPRPLPLDDFKRKNKNTHFLFKEWSYLRHTVKPGISGLWQVKGRNNLPFEKMILLDMYYVQNMTLIMDLKISFLTFFAVITSQGAY